MGSTIGCGHLLSTFEDLPKGRRGRGKWAGRDLAWVDLGPEPPSHRRL